MAVWPGGARGNGFGPDLAARASGLDFSEKFLERALTYAGESVSFLRMRLERIIVKRQKLLDRLPVTGEILRGSLLERTIRNHASGCAKMRERRRPPTLVLTVTYPGGGTRQFSVCAANGFPWCAAGCAISGPQGGNREHLRTSITSCCVRTKPRQRPGGRAVIKMRRAQLSFGDGLIHEGGRRSPRRLDDPRRPGA